MKLAKILMSKAIQTPITDLQILRADVQIDYTVIENRRHYLCSDYKVSCWFIKARKLTSEKIIIKKLQYVEN